MKTVSLHIGAHKTGSTSIQKFLAAADKALKEQGILYPKTGRPRENWAPYGHNRVWAQSAPLGSGGRVKGNSGRNWGAHRKFLHQCICEEDAGHLPIASLGQGEKQGEQEPLSVSRECVIPETGF